MDKAEHRGKNPLGILRECSANPSVDSNHRLSAIGQNQGGLQKSILCNRGGDPRQDLCFGEDLAQRTCH